MRLRILGALLALSVVLSFGVALVVSGDASSMVRSGSTLAIAANGATLPGSCSLTAAAVARPVAPRGTDEWTLWVGPTHLRGANIYQRRVYP
jgi:hypothetical protein